MDGNSTKTTIILVVAVVVLSIAYFAYDWLRSRSDVVDCNGEVRRTIDLREFRTAYSAYTIEVEASINDTQKISGKLEPKQLQQMSEALQQANEFRKYVVAGYNACAITSSQYAELGAKYQTLDSLARQINAFLSKSNLTKSDRANLSDLISQYVETASRLSSN